MGFLQFAPIAGLTFSGGSFNPFQGFGGVSADYGDDGPSPGADASFNPFQGFGGVSALH